MTPNKSHSKEANIKEVLSNRLSLQSVQRYLAAYKVDGKTSEYFTSPEFVDKHFNKLTSFQKKNFLIKIVGGSYWKEFQNMLEKIG